MQLHSFSSVAAKLGLLVTFLTLFSTSQAAQDSGLQIHINVNNLLQNTTNGRAVVLFSPSGSNPLDNTDSDGGDFFYGKNVFNLKGSDSITLSGGDGTHTRTEVFGHPNISLGDLSAGEYNVQAFLTKYERAYRSDGSVIDVRFPCGDGGMPINAPGSLTTDIVPVTITGTQQTIELKFTTITPQLAFTGNEIGGCQQGNYADTDTLKYVKIRSKALSKFWGRDMYVGANVALPFGYDANNKAMRYPVIYSQGHWPGASGGFGYPDNPEFSRPFDSGMTFARGDNPSMPTPKFILVTIRSENPFYDDSYNVNTANLGPWGEAIDDELVPHLDKMFNTIAEPYGRIQEGGSTGGWVSFASVVYRPDLYGASFSYYPDPLDFHRHQDINLYDYKNAYFHPDGTPIGSIRDFPDGTTEHIKVTTEQENHWELSQGTSSRSMLQWDVWNSVFGLQGLNGYPLEPWNKVTGEIYPEAVAHWKRFDMAYYISTYWGGERKLGEALRDRLHVSVGTHDDYFLNEGVAAFQKQIEPLGGPDFVNITFIPDIGHGGNYMNLNIWDYLFIVDKWIKDHSPDGPHPLSKSATSSKRRGNKFDQIINAGGRGAALRRQSNPKMLTKGLAPLGRPVKATTGTWDAGMNLYAQWLVALKPFGDPFKVSADKTISKVFPHSAKGHHVRLQVTGLKPGYLPETRKSEAVKMKGRPAW